MDKVENHSPLPRCNESGVGGEKQIFCKYVPSLSLMIDFTVCELSSRSWIPVTNYFDYPKIKYIHKLLFVGEKPEGHPGVWDRLRIIHSSLTSTRAKLSLKTCHSQAPSAQCSTPFPLFPSAEASLSTTPLTRKPFLLPSWEMSSLEVVFLHPEALRSQPVCFQMAPHPHRGTSVPHILKWNSLGVQSQFPLPPQGPCSIIYTFSRPSVLSYLLLYSV